MAKKKLVVEIPKPVRTKEMIEADIKTWDGVNKYIVENLKAELKKLAETQAKKK